MSQTVCRLCGSSRVRPRFPRSLLPLFFCQECGVIFRPGNHTKPPAEFYNRDYFLEMWPGSLGRFFYPFDPQAHHKTRFFLRQLQEFERQLSGPGRLLDVGCANGVFVWLAEQRGWQAEGLEISPFAAEWGREQFGITIHQGSLLDFHPQTEYDLITMWDTLEHLPQPQETLRACQKHLRPGGFLALLTPDTESLVNRLVHAGYGLMPSRGENFLKKLYHEDHLTCFDRLSLSRTLLQEGFLIHWLEGYDEAPEDTETSGLLRTAVRITRLAATLLHREHELLVWAYKPKTRRPTLSGETGSSASGQGPTT